MINVPDSILADLIQSRVPALAGKTQVGFDGSGQDWHKAVVTANEERLNIYLFDVRENLKLCSNERTREAKNAWYFERPDPPKRNCMYLLTTWSHVRAMPPDVEPTRDEHGLLYNVSEVLFRHRSMVVADVHQTATVIPSEWNLSSDLLSLLRDQEFPNEMYGRHQPSQ